MGYDAFISYRRENGFLMAQVIYDKLEEKGIHCFMDLQELQAGRFNEKILEAIKASDNFILILPKNALTRCKNENDWLRIEILEAINLNKRIIPVLCDGFEWPKVWNDGIPQDIRNIEYLNGVSSSREYLSAMIDKIISYMPDVKPESELKRDRKEWPKSTYEFFNRAIDSFSEIVSVDFAFPAGDEWRINTKKVSILSYIIENQIKLRIMLNTKESVCAISDNIAHPLKRRRTLDEIHDDWRDLERIYPDIVSVRVSKVPLLHRTYIIKGTQCGAANIKHYIYGRHLLDPDERESRQVFVYGSPEYKMFEIEYDYLWDNAKD